MQFSESAAIGILPLFADTSRGLAGVDYVITLLYLVGVLATGWYFSRQQQQGEDYFVAGRQMPWFAVGLSIVATMLSTVTYLAAPGEVIQHGLAMSIGWLAMPLAFLVVNMMWIPFIMRLEVTSIYEYLERRFGLVARWTAVVMFLFILRLLWMAIIVLTASKAVAQITYDSILPFLPGDPSLEQWTLALLLSVGLLATIYTMLGGIKAVIWTDVAQFVVLFGGVVITLVYVAIDTGTGPIDWWNTTTAGAVAEASDDKPDSKERKTESNIARTDEDKQPTKSGHKFPPLFSWDITVRTTILFTVLGSLFWYSCTFIGDQVAVQRYLTTSSIQAAVRGNIVNFVADFVIMVLLALCGMALLTYYLDPEFQTEIVEGIMDPSHKKAADNVFPHFIAHGLPTGVSGLVVAALFAVAMSSLDSGLNSVSAVLTIDVFNRSRPDRSKSHELRMARLITLIVGLICTAVACGMMGVSERYNIISMTARTFNCALGPIGAMFFTGMFIRRADQECVVVSTIFGLVVAICSAWWVELLWLSGLTGFSTLKLATDNMAGPSPFLITPIAATSTVALATLLSFVSASNEPERADRWSWRSVVKS